MLLDSNSNLVGYISWENDFITSLEVISDYRHNGIATKLLSIALSNRANKLSVNKRNVTAIDLYMKLGWVIYNTDARMLYMIHE